MLKAAKVTASAPDGSPFNLGAHLETGNVDAVPSLRGVPGKVVESGGSVVVLYRAPELAKGCSMWKLEHRRSAIEAVIGHMKTDGRLGRNLPKGRDSYRLVLEWLRIALVRIMAAMLSAVRLRLWPHSAPRPEAGFFTDDGLKP